MAASNKYYVKFVKVIIVCELHNWLGCWCKWNYIEDN